jgi:hypothetical protein
VRLVLRDGVAVQPVQFEEGLNEALPRVLQATLVVA